MTPGPRRRRAGCEAIEIRGVFWGAAERVTGIGVVCSNVKAYLFSLISNIGL